MQRSLWEMERLQIWTLSLKIKKKSCSHSFLLGGRLKVANINIKSIWTEKFSHQGSEMWSRRLLIVSIYGLGQVAPTRANNCLDTFPAVLNEQASLEEYFFFSFCLCYAPPWNFQRTTSEQKWKYCAGALNTWQIYVFHWKSWKRYFCRNSVENILFPAMLLLWHIFGGQPYSSRNRGARKCVGHKFGF